LLTIAQTYSVEKEIALKATNALSVRSLALVRQEVWAAIGTVIYRVKTKVCTNG
jgi:hypothetical protein